MNIIDFPVTAAKMSDEELGYQMAGSLGKLLHENVELEIELSCVRSWAASMQTRLESFQVRRLRFTVIGALAGALVTLALDGTAAQKLDHLLTFLGWSA